MVYGVLLIVSLLFFLLAVFFSLQVFLGVGPASLFRGIYGGEQKPARSNLDIVLLIPAHNEEEIIEHTLENLTRDHRNDVGRIIVIADNCSDQTAAKARKYDVEVIERFDEVTRGKGHAIAFGLDHLRNEPPEIIIILDADCSVEEGGLAQLASLAYRASLPVQGVYLLRRVREDMPARIAEFAFLIKNKIRPLGLRAMGMASPLFGSGMAFPWGVLLQSKIGNNHVTEDLLLGVELAQKRFPPLFCSEAKIWSSFPIDNNAEQSQRRRWEHGYLDVLVKNTPRLLSGALSQSRPLLFFVALDLAIPPLTLFILLLGGWFFLCCFLFGLTGALAPMCLTFFALSLVASALIQAWRQHGRSILSPKDIAYIPRYMGKKIPLYASFLSNRQKDWVRTSRKTNADEN